MNWKKRTLSLVLAGCMTASALPTAFAVEAQVETEPPVPVSEPVTAQPEVTAPAQDIQPEAQSEANAPKTADEPESAQPVVSAQAAAEPQTSVQGAESGKCGNNLTWTLDDKGTLIISGKGEMDNYSDDDQYAPWDDCRDSIKSVVIKPGVTSIGDGAFWNCSSLTGITIPNGVTGIGDYAFSYCESLTGITIANSVTSIGNGAFEGCGSLTSITIPSSVTSIGDGAFEGCSRLKSITADSQNRVYSSENGVLFNKKKTQLIRCPQKKSGEYVIPNSVTSIEDGAFEGCGSVTSITIPNGVTSIGEYAFSYCERLTSITIPSSVTSIGDGSFDGCDRLTSITADSQNRVYSSENGVLFNKKKTRLIRCPQKKSGEYVIPNSVTSIGEYAFSYCERLTDITIPNSVRSISEYAFYECESLTSITIPNSVTGIGDGAFSWCYGLNEIYFCGDAPNRGSNVFEEVTAAAYYPQGNSTWSKAVRESFGDEGNLTWKTWNPEVAVTGIKLNKTALTLNPKGTAMLTATITPSNATNKTVTWTTSNSKVATVSGGKVTAVAAGIATITAKSNNGKTATCTVTVVNPTVAVTGIKLDKTAVTLNPKTTATLTATITPSNATNKTVTWTTSNSKVATVSGGKVTAVAAGTATITVKSNNGKTATCKVTVVEQAKPSVTEVFSDVPADAWYVNAVQYAYDNNIMAGTGGKFNPNGTMTRAMVVQTLYNISGKPAVSGKPGFSDVKTTDWYGKAVLWAEQNKVAAGSDGKFNPNGLVTREQFAQMLYNYAGSPKVSGELRGFADTASVSGWAKNAITWANQKGIVNGKPSGGKLYLDPKGKATRAEAAAMLMKYKTM